MKIQITQNDYGNYNFSGNEKSTVFSMVIKDENGIVKVNNIPCRLQYSSDEDETTDFDDAIGNLEWTFEKCFEYSKKIWSSTDYEAQLLAFIKVYKENFEGIKENYLTSEKKRITDKIESLQKELAHISFEETDFSYPITKRLQQIEKRINSAQIDMAQYVDGSEKKLNCEEQIKRLNQERQKYQEIITPPNVKI